MIKEYKLNNKKIGEIKNVKHKITLNEQKIINLPAYRLSPIMKVHFDKEIGYLLQNKIILKSSSNFSSPAFPILKTNGRVRLVVEYRKINSITAKDSYIFPKISEIFTKLHNSSVFSTIDLNLGYYQIPMDRESIQYTAFSLNNQKYKFLRTPFRL
ncbi:Retrovirus-related Pol polyprotein from transposon [Dictyocoela muelleri]|nr:Retrovirus-related Pol polyprotein from transposon [Dictyocoela muelleri]